MNRLIYIYVLALWFLYFVYNCIVLFSKNVEKKKNNNNNKISTKK